MSGRIILYSVLAVTLFGILWFLSWNRRYVDAWRDNTTPLPPATIADLCLSFELDERLNLCSSSGPVYGPDFYPVIRSTLRPYEEYKISAGDAATYDETHARLAKFEVGCEPVVEQADGLSYFICTYDLRGDGAFEFAIFYTYPDLAVYRIATPMGYDD